MIIGQNETDRAYLVSMERRARCSGCGKWIEPGQTAWSYLASPFDGNYVEHNDCRYGPDAPVRTGVIGEQG